MSESEKLFFPQLLYTIRQVKNFGFINKSHFCFFELYLMYKLRVLATFAVDSVQLYIDVQVWCTSNFLHLTYLGVQAEPVDAKVDHGE